MFSFTITYFVVLLSSFASIRSKKHTLVLLILVTIWLILFAGLRYEVGLDYDAYRNFFQTITTNPDMHMELGFRFFTLILNLLDFDYQIMFFIVSLVTISLFVYFYYNYSKLPLLSIFLFLTMPLYFLLSFNTIRQCLAIAIFTLAIKYILNKSFIKFLIILIIASLFHKSALLMIPLYFINKPPSLKLYLVLSFIFMSLLFFIEVLVDFVGFSVIYLDNTLFNPGVDSKIYIYLLVFLYLYYKRTIFRKDNYFNLFLNMYFLSSLFLLTPLITDLPSAPILRMTSFFSIVLPILLLDILSSLRSSPIKNLFFIGLIIFSSVYFFTTLYFKGESLKLLPYEVNINLIR